MINFIVTHKLDPAPFETPEFSAIISAVKETTYESIFGSAARCELALADTSTPGELSEPALAETPTPLYSVDVMRAVGAHTASLTDDDRPSWARV